MLAITMEDPHLVDSAANGNKDIVNKLLDAGADPTPLVHGDLHL